MDIETYEGLYYEINEPMSHFCENKAVICLPKDPIHHDQPKHAEIDKHFIKGRIVVGSVQLVIYPYSRTGSIYKIIPFREQTLMILMFKLGLIDIYYYPA